ncbi:hypothetical protein [Paenibacillus sp. Root444D2]|uniref:hypothetical protein n=1 Tax=Paenibacillus sp. Root444D2 TaxID=1736538 RepID=UPI000B1C2BA4|nr:hypothetical protein [Paenibacillus sp. Root444D2]
MKVTTEDGLILEGSPEEIMAFIESKKMTSSILHAGVITGTKVTDSNVVDMRIY